MGQLEELIKEIAVKHGIAVSRDDPILVLQTINNRLMQDTMSAQQAQLDRYKEDLEGLTLRWSEDSKARAEKILNASLAASKAAMTELMQSASKSAASAVKAEIEAALKHGVDPVRETVRDARRISILNVVASCITCAAAAIALWASLGH